MFTTSHVLRRFPLRLLLAAAFLSLLLALGACGTQSQSVSQMPTIYTQVTASFRHTCALVSDGTAQCWGMNSDGQLGNTFGYNAQATPEERHMRGYGNNTPVTIKGLTDVTAISAGDSHTCALTRSGAVKCWGRNNEGQLGDGTLTQSSAPVRVANLTGAIAISAMFDQTCALLGGGTVKCWGGANAFGQLGNNNRQDDSFTPVAVQGLTGATAIGVGFSHTCALLNSGTVKCWGINLSGELGNGASNPGRNPTPVAVKELTGVTAISVGGGHTCALLGDGTIQCWGKNRQGQLGNGGETDSSTPVAVKGLTGVTAISAGSAHTCVLLGDGAVKCWGGNGNAQLGNGSKTDSSSTPVAVQDLTNVTAISAGGSYTCALRRDGSIWCWGRNGEGQLGDGTRDKPGAQSRSTPVRVRN